MNIYEIQKANPDIFTRLFLKDQLFCYYECPQKEKIIQLYSNHNQLTFTLNGKRIITHGNYRWTATDKKGILLKRGAFHQEIPDDFADWKVLVIYLKDDYLKKVFEEFRPHFSLSNLLESDTSMMQEFTINEQIQNSYKSLLPYFSKPQLLPDAIFEGKFKELLFNILMHPENRQILAYVNQIVDGYTVPVWEIMESNYYYDLTIAEFANMANRSTSTFRREFEEHYQTTPGRWLTAKRLEKAAVLLRSSGRSISEITFDCGFKNISHFSRIFKENFQLSPTEYRRKVMSV